MTRKGQGINSHICGLKGDNMLFYQVDLEVTDLKLDKDGFMVEHGIVDKLAKHAIKQGRSCEIVAQGLLQMVEKRAKESGRMKIKNLSVMVGLLGGQAHFTVTLNGK